ncbi:hypothetical protein Pcinc_039069 [Petrolisthes cinctipes]|uniref:Uncharacterized protein n=1 Tax=Petrolisthes cinctipes TaxID=88211 RepID=A0AAE1EMA7_PETCI|nr:hypothetical protein Pcinc_039069 [Petrolisthes cinctipes]
MDGQTGARKDGQKAATHTLPYHMDRRRTDHQREGLHQIQHHGRKIQDASIRYQDEMDAEVRYCAGRDPGRMDGRLKAAKWPQELKSNGSTTHTLTTVPRGWKTGHQREEPDCIRSSTTDGRFKMHPCIHSRYQDEMDAELHESPVQVVGGTKKAPASHIITSKPRQCHCTRPRALQEEQEICSCIDIATYPHPNVKPNPSILAPLLPPTLSSNSSVATSV